MFLPIIIWSFVGVGVTATPPHSSVVRGPVVSGDVSSSRLGPVVTVTEKILSFRHIRGVGALFERGLSCSSPPVDVLPETDCRSVLKRAVAAGAI